MKPCTVQGAGAVYGELGFPSKKNNYLTKKEFDEIDKRYIEIGEPNIDKTDRVRISCRAKNMGEQLSRYYHLFEKYPSEANTEKLHLAIMIAQILRDVNALELNDEEYVDWFIKHCSSESEEYIETILFLRKIIKG